MSGAIDFTFPLNAIIGGTSYVVVAAVPVDMEAVHALGGVFGPFSGTNGLQNSSGNLLLRNRTGAVLFEASYSGDIPWPAAADGAGHSLVLARPSFGEGDVRAWAASDGVGGSPGRGELAGENPYRAVVINEFLAHSIAPAFDFIELFNESSQAVDLSGCILSDDPALNKFVIPPGSIIPPQGFISFSDTELRFGLSSAGEAIFFKSPNATRILDAIRFEGQARDVSTGRSPDGAPWCSPLLARTPGANNAPSRLAEIVINEIMYHPISGESDDEYVELYNRSANMVGDFDGALANGGERLALAAPEITVTTNSLNQAVTNMVYFVENEVTYGTGGRWGRWSDGGGSSLELRHARSDSRRAPNWTDSDERAKSEWKTIEFTGLLDNGIANPDSLQILLLGEGECLVDDVEVFRPGSANVISNPGFETGVTGWFFQGTHHLTGWETNSGFNSSRSLHVRATGRGDTGANRVRTPLNPVLRIGQAYTLRAKVRWLSGHPEILLRMHGGFLEASGNSLTARNLGTPGAPNSRALANAGPAITDVAHRPVLPAAGQAITVSARVYDPDGLASVIVKYRVDPSMEMSTARMFNRGAGLFTATIPGQPDGTLVAFQVQASDNSPAQAASVFPADAPARECLVRWGETVPEGAFGAYRFWITQATFDAWSNRAKNSNEPLDATFAYGDFRVIYNAGAMYSGSPFHTPGFNTPTGNPCDYVLRFDADDAMLGATGFVLAGPGTFGDDTTGVREQAIWWIARELGVPSLHRRYVHMFVNGQRRSWIYEGLAPDHSYGSFPDGQPFHRTEFSQVTPGGTNDGPAGPIVVYLNEWMADNTRTLLNAKNHYDDWFEIYNPGSHAVDLAGYYLTDDLANKFQFAIPAGYPIAAGGHLLVWADGAANLNGIGSGDLHVNFKLAKDGEALGLFALDGARIDSVTFGTQTNDVSQGRYPDGAGPLCFMSEPTPRAPNRVPGLANTPPVLQHIESKTVNELSLISFRAQAVDADQPPQALDFSLATGAPAGASMTSAGQFRWRPSESQGPGVYSISVRVTDHGDPPSSHTKSFSVAVNEVNSAPWFERRHRSLAQERRG